MSIVAIIDYGSGNLHSAAKAFERMAADTGHEVAVTSDPAVVKQASHIVLPGVGAYGDCRAGLDAVPGMVAALKDAVLTQKKPFLGICVGMQLMAEKGLERGEHAGLGWLPGQVEKITPNDIALKIPHMGWNALNIIGKHKMLAGISSGAHAYFVHSYHMRTEPQFVLATAEYGGYITAIVAKGNMVGTQFHPEKSQETGLALIKNFLLWDGSAPNS